MTLILAFDTNRKDTILLVTLYMQREMQSETGATGNQQVQSAADTRGKHRVSAELKRLEQESRFLEVSSLC